MCLRVGALNENEFSEVLTQISLSLLLVMNVCVVLCINLCDRLSLFASSSLINASVWRIRRI